VRLGTEPDRLDALAMAIEDAGWALVDGGSELVVLFAATTWTGADRQRVATSVAEFRDLGERTGDRLRSFADRARRHADEQRRVSDAPLLGGPDAPHTTLLRDDAGDGLRVVAIGDPSTARAVVVLVPGVGTTSATFGHLLGDAERLHTAATGLVGDAGAVAVVAWLGYDAPAGLEQPWRWGEAVSDRRARLGAERLRPFLADVARDGATLTVIGHSYGSLVAAKAARHNADVDRLVVIGSPGVGADAEAGLELAPDTTMFAAALPGDPVVATEWFGRSPADPHFGAWVLESDPWPGAPVPSALHAHSAYFAEGSQLLDNLARVSVGRRPRSMLSGRRSPR